MIRLSSLISEQGSRPCPRCQGSGEIRDRRDGSIIACDACSGSGKAYWGVPKTNKLRELDAGYAGADNMGSFRSVATDDPFAARIQLANLLRKFGDYVESVADNASQFDPKKDTYDSQAIEGFVDTVSQTQKMVSQAIAFWKQRMAKIDQSMEKQL